MTKSVLNRFERLRNYISEIEGKIISAREFSSLLGVSHSLVGSIEREDIPPSPKVAARLEEKYDISKEWYLTGEGLAPWEEKEYDHYFKELDDMVRKAEYEKVPVGLDKATFCLFAGTRISNTPQRKLIDYFIEAGRNPEFRSYIYNILYNVLEGGAVNVFQELQQAREKIEKLKSQQ